MVAVTVAMEAPHLKMEPQTQAVAVEVEETFQETLQTHQEMAAQAVQAS